MSTTVTRGKAVDLVTYQSLEIRQYFNRGKVVNPGDTPLSLEVK